MNIRFIFSSKLFLSILILGFNLGTQCSNKIIDTQKKFDNFWDWKIACDKLPQLDNKIKNPYNTPLTEDIILAEIDRFFITMEKQFDKIHWIDGIKPDISCNEFQAFTEKIIVPTDAIIAIHGDVHGDIHSINQFIETFKDKEFLDQNNPFKIKNKKFYILFLGDYVDRGWYGSEVIYTVLRLKNENPDNVFMVRGNHEDMSLNFKYGFSKEINKKFLGNSLVLKIRQLYNLLPVAIYLGAGKENRYNIIQCCHGGIEIGFDPKTLLENKHTHAGIKLSRLMQKDGFENACCSETSKFKKYFHNNKQISSGNGFMWSDFIVDPNKALALSSRDGFRGTMFEFGQSITKQLLKAWSGTTYKLRSIFRAHQHGDHDMRDRILNIDKLSHADDTGIGKLWIQNSVHQKTPALLDDVAAITFSVAPHAGYEWPSHSFAQLNITTDYVDWRLNVFNKSVILN
jgi:hypothetical protein